MQENSWRLQHAWIDCGWYTDMPSLVFFAQYKRFQRLRVQVRFYAKARLLYRRDFSQSYCSYNTFELWTKKIRHSAENSRKHQCTTIAVLGHHNVKMRVYLWSASILQQIPDYERKPIRRIAVVNTLKPACTTSNCNKVIWPKAGPSPLKSAPFGSGIWTTV